MSTQAEEYLGDGLYASFDGVYVALRAPREDGDYLVYLEPSVFSALVDFAKKINVAHDVKYFTWSNMS